MNKETAIKAIQENLKSGGTHADKYFVTTDSNVYTKAAMAVAHAAHLSPGDPQVLEVEHKELGDVPPPPSELTEEEREIQNNLDRIEALEKEKTTVQAEIDKFGSDDEIDQLNAAEKLHVANLKERLDDINEGLAIPNAGS